MLTGIDRVATKPEGGRTVIDAF